MRAEARGPEVASPVGKHAGEAPARRREAFGGMGIGPGEGRGVLKAVT
jgi:hypothetical protein